MFNKKQVLIFTEGGRKIGFGHIARCIGLYQNFPSDKFDIQIIVNGDKNIDFLFKNIKYEKSDWLKNLNKFLNNKNIDIGIIDSYMAQIDLYEKISREVKIPIYIDDYKRLIYPKGIVINPSIYGDKIKYPLKKNVKYLLGRKFIILRKDFLKKKKKIIKKKNIKNLLISFGGMNWKKFRENLINYLKHKYNFNFFIVEPQKMSSPIKIVDLMLKCDICISGGGQTTYELAKLGVPTIGICFSENQIYNLKYGEKFGYLKFAGWYNDKSIFEKVMTIIEKMDYKKLKRMSEIGPSLIDGKGAERIVKEIIKNI